MAALPVIAGLAAPSRFVRLFTSLPESPTAPLAGTPGWCCAVGLAGFCSVYLGVGICGKGPGFECGSGCTVRGDRRGVHADLARGLFAPDQYTAMSSLWEVLVFQQVYVKRLRVLKTKEIG